MSTKEIMEKLKNAVIEGDNDTALQCAEEGLKLGMDPLDVVKEGIQSAMDYVGEQFQNGDMFLPELIVAGDAATAAMNVLMAKIEASGGSASKGKIVLGVMFGDNHDIGKNLVMAVLAANGFKVIDMGVNVSPKVFIETAMKEKADIIALSTLITTSLPYQREIIELLKAMGKREEFFVILGGGPVTPEWTSKIGADGYGRDAKDAANLCLKLMSGGSRPPLGSPILENALAARSNI